MAVRSRLQIEMDRRSSIVFLACVAASGPAAAAACPPAPVILDQLATLDTTRTWRHAQLGIDLPERLLARAAAAPGRPYVQRNGHLFAGALLVALPAAPIWAAISDEEHFTEEFGYLPLETSRLIDGRRGDPRRRLLQSFARWGVRRWWVSESAVNTSLYSRTEGRMWETTWHGIDLPAETIGPAAIALARTHRPVARNRGSWVLIPVSPSCTVVEYAAETAPGGFIGLFQWLFATREVRRSLAGIARMAAEHVPRAHAGETFAGPDETPLRLGSPPAASPG